MTMMMKKIKIIIAIVIKNNDDINHNNDHYNNDEEWKIMAKKYMWPSFVRTTLWIKIIEKRLVHPHDGKFKLIDAIIDEMILFLTESWTISK